MAELPNRIKIRIIDSVLLISQRIPDKPVFKQCAAFHNGKIHKAGTVITFVLKFVWDLSALPD